MLIPALVRSNQRFWLLLIVGGVYGLVFLLILLLFPSTQISRRSFGFAHAASCSSMSVFYPLMLHDMLDAPLYALDAVVALLVVLVLGGAMVVALDAKLKALHEAAILMCAIGAASLFYVLGAAGA